MRLLVVVGVGVVPVLEEPALEDLDRLLGEVAAALAGRGGSRAGVLLAGAVLVGRGAGVSLAFADCEGKRKRERTINQLESKGKEE